MQRSVMRDPTSGRIRMLSASVTLVAALSACDALWSDRSDYELVRVNGKMLPVVADTAALGVVWDPNNPRGSDSTVRVVYRWVSASLVLRNGGRYELTILKDGETIGAPNSRVSIPLAYEGQYDSSVPQPLIHTYEGGLGLEFQDDGRTLLLRDKGGSFGGAVFEFARR